ncbi:MAG: diguanylate cyclase [Rhodocyclaceae bacterium]|nr:diguanylate cyclase [Rhodocyclaceae bacterium]
MNKPTNPSEVARETLKQLALRRKLPTPDNYRELYHEIAGTRAAEAFPAADIKTLISSLPKQNNDQAKLVRKLELALANQSWRELSDTLKEFVEVSTAEPPNWATLIRTVITQIQKRHAGHTSASKRDALESVLAASSSQDALFSRLQSVMRSWGNAAAADDSESEECATTITPDGTGTKPALRELQELMASLLDNAIAMMLTDEPALLAESQALAEAIRNVSDSAGLNRLTERVKKFSYKLHFVAEDQSEMKVALLQLVQLIVDNINELVVDDTWLSGQVTIVRELMGEPITLRRLDDVERRMKDVIFKQSALKHSLNDAKDRLKEMLATFVDRLADLSESTSGYHDKIEHCAERISKANDISELSDVLDEVMRETRTIQVNARRSRDELAAMRVRVDESEKEVVRLQEELANASDLVRTDALTGALNRKGMDEAIEREAARANRQGSPLCMALLDIDNFKKLNDGLGHAAGDAALVHLSTVVQETIRPHDTLARYGGEEFVVIMPDTSMDDAVTAMVRVQRELTRKFFLHNNDKVLITFSCGVAQLGAGEVPAEALKRADSGMYIAKRAGKNRVVPT